MIATSFTVSFTLLDYNSAEKRGHSSKALCEACELKFVCQYHTEELIRSYFTMLDWDGRKNAATTLIRHGALLRHNRSHATTTKSQRSIDLVLQNTASTSSVTAHYTGKTQN